MIANGIICIIKNGIIVGSGNTLEEALENAKKTPVARRVSRNGIEWTETSDDLFSDDGFRVQVIPADELIIGRSWNTTNSNSSNGNENKTTRQSQEQEQERKLRRSCFDVTEEERRIGTATKTWF